MRFSFIVNSRTPRLKASRSMISNSSLSDLWALPRDQATWLKSPFVTSVIFLEHSSRSMCATNWLSCLRAETKDHKIKSSSWLWNLWTDRFKTSFLTSSKTFAFVSFLLAKDHTISNKWTLRNLFTPRERSWSSKKVKKCLLPFPALLNAQRIWIKLPLLNSWVPRLIISPSTRRNNLSALKPLFANDHTNSARAWLSIFKKSLARISSKKTRNNPKEPFSAFANDSNIADSNWLSNVEISKWPFRMASSKSRKMCDAVNSRLAQPLTIWQIPALLSAKMSRERISFSQIWTSLWFFSSIFPKDHITLTSPLDLHSDISFEIFSSNSTYLLLCPSRAFSRSFSNTNFCFSSFPMIFAIQ